MFLQASSVKVLYHFSKENAKRDSYYQMLDAYIRFEVQQLPQNAVFQHGTAPTHVTPAVRYLLGAMFQNSWIERYAPARSPEKSPSLASLDFFFGGFSNDQLCQTSVSK